MFIQDGVGNECLRRVTDGVVEDTGIRIVLQTPDEEVLHIRNVQSKEDHRDW